MDTFTDYYTLLGVDAHTSTHEIRAAFKKLALQYHPDVYKGEDAQERMRLLLLAYQTLSDPAERKAYDARRSEYVLGASVPHSNVYTKKSSYQEDVSPAARRDRQRHYAFPDLQATRPIINLGDMTYELAHAEACILEEQGMFRGIAPTTKYTGTSPQTIGNPSYCHRCHRRWTPAATTSRGRSRIDICPACKARDWSEFLLLCCTHCHAVFESEQIRYEVGTYHYGDSTLCPPYELFPLCPYCGASGWCPAEDTRVHALRLQAKRRTAFLRLIWFSVIMIFIIVLAVIAVMLLK
jgi:hypothetical protein